MTTSHNTNKNPKLYKPYPTFSQVWNKQGQKEKILQIQKPHIAQHICQEYNQVCFKFVVIILFKTHISIVAYHPSLSFNEEIRDLQVEVQWKQQWRQHYKSQHKHHSNLESVMQNIV